MLTTNTGEARSIKFRAIGIKVAVAAWEGIVVGEEAAFGEGFVRVDIVEAFSQAVEVVGGIPWVVDKHEGASATLSITLAALIKRILFKSLLIFLEMWNFKTSKI